MTKNDKTYHLHLDGKLFRRQRELLMSLVALVHVKQVYSPNPGDEGLLEGLLALTDEIADQAHDRYGIDCLLEDGDKAVECQAASPKRQGA